MYQFIEHLDTSKNCVCTVYLLLLATICRLNLIFVFNFFIIAQTEIAFSQVTSLSISELDLSTQLYLRLWWRII